MLDPIDIAKQKLKVSNTLKVAESVDNKAIIASSKEKLAQLSNPAVGLAAVKKLSPIQELPIQPDPELLKKEAMARAQTIRSDAEQMLQQKKEEELNKVRDKVETAGSLVGAAVALYFKLEITDPKFLANMAYMKAKEKVRELKQKASKENLKKSKEAFTFPMKPPIKLDLGELPKPTIPKIPDLPRIDLPNS